MALWGVSYFSATVRLWLIIADQTAPSVAGFLYVTLAAFAAGLTLGAIRVVTVDPLHHCTGVAKPEWNFSEFQQKFWAFNQLVESHYCFYQFYAHMGLALPLVVAAHLLADVGGLPWWLWVGCAGLELVLLTVSRLTLKTYYTQASDLLGIENGGSPLNTGKSLVKSSQKHRTKLVEKAGRAASQESATGQAKDEVAPNKVRRW